MPLPRLRLGGSLVAVLDQALVSGGSFLATVLVARHLGVEGFGVYSLAWLAVLLAGSLQLSLIVAPLYSLWPKQAPGRAAPWFTTVLLHQLGFTAVMACAVPPLVWLAGAPGLALPILVAGVAVQLQDYARRYLFCRGRAVEACLNDALVQGTRVALLLWLLPGGQVDVAGALLLSGLPHLLGLPWGIWRQERFTLRPAYALAVTRRHWRLARWLLPSSLLIWIGSSLFPLAAGALLGAAAVGALQAAGNLVRVTNLLFQGLENVVPRQAAWHLHHAGPRALRRYLGRVALAGGGLTAVVAGCFLLAPDRLMVAVFGAGFAGTGGALAWMALANLLMFFLLPLQSGLQAVERTRSVFRAYLAGTLAGAAALWPLAHSFGLAGVILALASHYAIIALVMAAALAPSLRRGKR